MAQIFAGRFENNDSSAVLLEQFKNVANVGIRHANDRFGTERIEVTLRGYGPYDAYDRYKNHHGQRLAIYSPQMSRPISGWITGVEWLGGNLIQYIAKGPIERMADIPDTTEYTTTQTVTNAITNVLSNYIAIDDGTTDNIVTNSTQLQGWQPNRPQGGYAADIIPQLLAKSDGSNRIYDFIFIDERMNGVSLNQFTPYYTYREDSATPNWIVYRKDLRRAPNLSRTIDDFITTARVWYGLIQGTATGGSDTTLSDTTKNFIIAGVNADDPVTNITNGGQARVTTVTANTLTIEGAPFFRGEMTGGSTTTLIDTAVNFVADAGVAVNDVVYNDSDDSRGVVTSITTTTNTNDTLNFSGAMSGSHSNDATERYRIVKAFSSSDVYSIRTKAQTKYQEATTSTTPYWARTRSVFEPSMNETQAAQFATVLADTEPQQQQSIVIGSKYIRDSNGALWILPEVIAQGGGYIQIADLYPYAALSSTSRDRLTTFKITGMNYDHANNTLTCSLDTSENELDARLQRANIINGRMVMREGL